MIQFNTVEEALEELKKGRIILVTEQNIQFIIYLFKSY